MWGKGNSLSSSGLGRPAVCLLCASRAACDTWGADVVARAAAETEADAATANQAVIAEAAAAMADATDAGSFTSVSGFAAFADGGFEDRVGLECMLGRASRAAAPALWGSAAGDSADNVSCGPYDELLSAAEESDL